jgi:hypothetical protein
MWPGLPVDLTVVDLVAEFARHVVYLSTDVPDLADDAPALSFHQEIERRLRHSAVEWTFLRAIDFATNTLAWADQIRAGVVRLPYGRAARSLIHERDIADVASTCLPRQATPARPTCSPDPTRSRRPNWQRSSAPQPGAPCSGRSNRLTRRASS